jgi:hypothetical protein
MFSRVHAALCASCVVACSVDNPPAVDPTKSLDEAVFKCKVEPILARLCSYNACHGNAQSALRVYTPGKLRAAPPATLDDQLVALTDAEHHANFLSAAGLGFGITSVDDHVLLRKPLPSSDGGFEHKGGAIYAKGVNDPAYTTIRTWLEGKGSCP